MNLTLSVDEKTLKRARRVAQAMGKSLNQVIREHLERMAAEGDAEAAVAELRELWGKAAGHSGGWVFSRDEVHER